MPLPAFFSVLFFLVLLSLGFDSAFSLFEGTTTAFKDRLKASSHTIAFWTVFVLASCIWSLADPALQYSH